MADTDTEELTQDEQDELDKKKPIGKPIAAPTPSPASLQAATAPIGKPIVPPQPEALPGATPITPNAPPPEVASVNPPTTPTPSPVPGTISGMGPLSPQQPTPQGSSDYQNANARLQGLQAADAGHHGTIGKILDAIAMSTRFGPAIESATGTGSYGRQVGIEHARQGVEDVNKQIEGGEKARGANATAAKTGAEAGEATARGEATEAGMQNVTITDPVSGHTMTVPASQAPAIWKAIVAQSGANTRTAGTNQTREDVAADTNATRSNIAANTNQARENIAKEGNQTKEDIFHNKPEPQAEQGLNDYMKAQGLPNTPEGRDLARADMETRKSGGDADAKAAAAVKALGLSAKMGYKRLQGLIKEDNDPANYAFLMSFIGLSYEAIKGARLNQAEIVRAAATRSLPTELQNVYDLWVNKRVLVPEQKQQMLKTAEIIASSYDDNKGETSKPSATGGGQPESTTPGPKVGEVDSGYRFKGGNPSDKNSWEKVQ